LTKAGPKQVRQGTIEQNGTNLLAEGFFKLENRYHE
jgi:hypothetical protein